MSILIRFASLASILVAAACSSCDPTSTTSSEITGTATYRDAETDHAGAPAEPAEPATSATITMVVSGTGSLPDVDPQCALDPAGQFEATYVSNVNLAEGSAYVAAVGNGTVATPSGCAISNATALVVTDVRIRAELETTTASCDTYCTAHARAEGEAQCGATASAAACRENAEASATASCTTTCTTRAEAIVAETSVAATLFTDLDLAALRGAVFGDLEADLTFDHMEDASGNSL